MPWTLWGHSGGGHWAGGMLRTHPDRVVAAWLVPLDGTEAVPSAEYQGDSKQAIWLPNEAVALAWKHSIAVRA